MRASPPWTGFLLTDHLADFQFSGDGNSNPIFNGKSEINDERPNRQERNDSLGGPYPCGCHFSRRDDSCVRTGNKPLGRDSRRPVADWQYLWRDCPRCRPIILHDQRFLALASHGKSAKLLHETHDKDLNPICGLVLDLFRLVLLESR